MLKSKRKYFKMILLINAFNNLGGKPNKVLVTDKLDFSSPYLAFIGISQAEGETADQRESDEGAKQGAEGFEHQWNVNARGQLRRTICDDCSWS